MDITPVSPITLTEEQFAEQFPLIANHLDKHAAFDGHQFETYGPEVDFVRQQNSDCIFTVMTDDNGSLCAASGFHFVNRLGYLVSSVPIPDGADYFIPLEEPRTVADQYGLACPDCGGDDAMHIVVESWATLSSDGTETYGDQEWDDNSACRCNHCNKCGTVAEFRILSAKPSTASP